MTSTAVIDPGELAPLADAGRWRFPASHFEPVSKDWNPPPPAKDSGPQRGRRVSTAGGWVKLYGAHPAALVARTQGWPPSGAAAPAARAAMEPSRASPTRVRPAPHGRRARWPSSSRTRPGSRGARPGLPPPFRNHAAGGVLFHRELPFHGGSRRASRDGFAPDTRPRLSHPPARQIHHLERPSRAPNLQEGDPAAFATR